MATANQKTKGAVLLTGAAGGIGLVTARRLTEQGFLVLAGVRKEADGERLRRTISARIVPVLLDITDQASIEAAVITVGQIVGTDGLAGLINNAGLIVEGPVELVSLAEARKQFEVNVIGQIAVTQAFLPLLRQGRGRLINVGAPSGEVALPYMGVLSASKAALAFLNDALRVELRPWQIEVSLIVPGAMKTEIFQKAATSAEADRRTLASPRVQQYAAGLAAYRKSVDAQRLDDPELVADAILHALTARKPKTSYAVGRGSALIGLVRLLPDRTRDNLLMSMLGLNKIQVG